MKPPLDRRRIYLIGDTGRKARIVGETVAPRDGKLLLVNAEDGLGNEYEELYRPDGTWPFNALGNFDLRPIARRHP